MHIDHPAGPGLVHEGLEVEEGGDEDEESARGPSREPEPGGAVDGRVIEAEDTSHEASDGRASTDAPQPDYKGRHGDEERHEVGSASVSDPLGRVPVET